eukprot:scaffold1129_cov164-Amphora_coffeaeformis.AAC.11
MPSAWGSLGCYSPRRPSHEIVKFVEFAETKTEGCIAWGRIGMLSGVAKGFNPKAGGLMESYE